MSNIPNMRGKSVAMLHGLFQKWLLTSFPPERMPGGETAMLMWAAWRESHNIHLAGKESTIKSLEAEVAEWKANHDNMVDRCAMLRQRPDLPVERIPAYEALVEAQERAQQLDFIVGNNHIWIDEATDI